MEKIWIEFANDTIASAKDGEGAGRGPCGLRKSVQVSVAQASLLACMTERFENGHTWISMEKK